MNDDNKLVNKDTPVYHPYFQNIVQEQNLKEEKHPYRKVVSLEQQFETLKNVLSKK